MLKRLIRLIFKVLRRESVVAIERDADTWDKQFETGNWDYLLELPKNIPVVTDLCREIAEKKGGTMSILDVGCGNGALAAALFKLNLDVSYYGTDVSKVALEKAKALAPDGEFRVSPMEEDPDFRERFDIIVFSEVLYYGDYKRSLSVHRKYLKPGGLVVISLYDTWRTRYIWFTLRHILTYMHKTYVKDKEKGVGWHIRVGRFRQ